MLDSYQFKPLIKNWRGYNSSKDKTVLVDGWLVKGSQNVYKKRSGTIAVRPGLKRYDVADTTLAGVKSDYVWNASFGSTRVLRVANGKLSVLFNSVWYNLLSGLASTTVNFSFRKWWDNTEKKERLLFCQGDSTLRHWSGGIATISSTTANTITKTGTTSWAQEGFASNTVGEKKLLINGNSYTYTGGETTTTLTGVSGNPTGEANGSIVLQDIILQANTPASGFNIDFLEMVNSQLYCFSQTSRLVYIAKATDFTNFTVPGTRVVGDPELVILDSLPKAVAVRQGQAHISAGSSDWYVISFQDITVSTTLVNQTNRKKIQIPGRKACLGYEFIDVVGDTIVYLSQDQQLMTYGDYRNIFQPAYPSLSLPIFEELNEETFTGGELRAIGEFIYITAPNNGKTYLYQTRQYIDELGNIRTERIWHPPFIWNVSRICVISGIEYGFSNANPQLYQLWDTGQWHDDSPTLSADGVTYEQLPYKAIAKLAYRNHGKREGIIYFDKVFYEGYLTQGTELNGDILYEYQGSENIITVNVNSSNKNAKLLYSVQAPSLGDASFGDNPLGDVVNETTNDQELLPKFKDIESVTQVNCSEYQLTLYSEQKDARWELLVIGTNVAIAEEEAPIKFIKR